MLINNNANFQVKTNKNISFKNLEDRIKTEVLFNELKGRSEDRIDRLQRVNTTANLAKKTAIAAIPVGSAAMFLGTYLQTKAPDFYSLRQLEPEKIELAQPSIEYTIGSAIEGAGSRALSIAPIAYIVGSRVEKKSKQAILDEKSAKMKLNILENITLN